MGIEPPFLYDAVRSDYSFDPKAVTRASFSPPAPRPKRPDGPLVNFNQHPDSYIIVPYGNTNAQPMDPSVKKQIKWARLVLLVLRAFQLIGAVGLLVMMILISGVNSVTGWIVRIVPAVAIIHTVYGVYHLGRRAGGRTPGSSLSYMLFASFFDISIIPFYAFSAYVAKMRNSGWKTIISDQSVLPTLIDVVFYAATVGGGLHLMSLAISGYLAFTFRKITQLPPDMNPLEDNLTSRHKRNKSSLSTATTLSPSEKRFSNPSEKRLSEPFENKRRSGAPYEDLIRQPTVPFLHTRDNSTDSFQSKHASPRSSRTESPARYNGNSPQRSPRHSTAYLKRTSVASNSPKRISTHSYDSVSTSDPSNMSFHTAEESGEDTNSRSKKTAWFTNDSIGKNGARIPEAVNSSPASPGKSSSPMKSYQAIPLDPSELDDDDDDDDDDNTENYQYHIPNPLTENPPTPRHFYPSSSSTYSTDPVAPQPPIHKNTSTDITDATSSSDTSYDWPLRSPTLRELTPKPLRTRSGDAESLKFKARSYGELKPATPPLLVGANRQVSSGVDLGEGRRDVSGKVAEEGRAGAVSGQWGARFRKISGLAGLQIS